MQFYTELINKYTVQDFESTCNLELVLKFKKKTANVVY